MFTSSTKTFTQLPAAPGHNLRPRAGSKRGAIEWAPFFVGQKQKDRRQIRQSFRDGGADGGAPGTEPQRVLSI